MVKLNAYGELVGSESEFGNLGRTDSDLDKVYHGSLNISLGRTDGQTIFYKDSRQDECSDERYFAKGRYRILIPTGQSFTPIYENQELGLSSIGPGILGSSLARKLLDINGERKVSSISANVKNQISSEGHISYVFDKMDNFERAQSLEQRFNSPLTRDELKDFYEGFRKVMARIRND